MGQKAKWIVKIEDVKYHVLAEGIEDAKRQALKLVVIKAYPANKHEE